MFSSSEQIKIQKCIFIVLMLLLSGPSGSGKSFLISQCAIKLAKLQSKTKQRNRILICTFTNEAANE
jgi:ATP-dependent exoDNAse (exonuclease V) beta subunit